LGKLSGEKADKKKENSRKGEKLSPLQNDIGNGTGKQRINIAASCRKKVKKKKHSVISAKVGGSGGGRGA